MADYAKLATTLRAAQRNRAQRIERERPAKEADAGHLALDDVLDFLHTDGARNLLAQVDQRLRIAVAESDRIPAPAFSVGPHPRKLDDPFLEGIVDFYRRHWDTDMDAGRLPQAITSSFSRWTGHDGYLHAPSAGSKDQAGEVGNLVLHSLKALGDEIPRSSLDGSSKATGKYSGLDMIAAGKVAFSKARDGYLDRMPVVRELLGLLGDDALKGFSMASVQHLFPSSMGLYDALFKAGQDPETTFIGGKYYSANVNTVALMEATGMRVVMDATEVTDHIADAEADVKQMARAQLVQMFRGVDPNQTTPRFLLLDDGGKLIQALHEDPALARYAHLCVAVEQTTRGIQVIDEMESSGHKLLCPVVNMALSDLKRRFESPLIAESVAWHIDRSIESLGLPRTVAGDDGPRKREAVVAGFGNTGAATAEALRRHGYHVIVTDTDPGKLDEAAALGFEALGKAAALPRAELFVGSTGRGALSQDDWGLLPSGAVLVNGASGNHELGIGSLSFEALNKLDAARQVGPDGAITTAFGGQKLTLGHENDDVRLTHRAVQTPNGKELLFLRGGSVVNMEHDLPPEYRQIIVGMLVASCAQAVQATGEGDKRLLELDPKMQAFLLSRFKRSLNKMRLPLDPPDFDAIKAPFG